MGQGVCGLPEEPRVQVQLTQWWSLSNYFVPLLACPTPKHSWESESTEAFRGLVTFPEIRLLSLSCLHCHSYQQFLFLILIQDLGSLSKVCLSHKMGHPRAGASQSQSLHLFYLYLCPYSWHGGERPVNMYPWHEVLDSGDIKVSVFQGTPVTLHAVSAMRCIPDSTMLNQQGLGHTASNSAGGKKHAAPPHRCRSLYPWLSGWFPTLVQRQHINSERWIQGPVEWHLGELQ